MRAPAPPSLRTRANQGVSRPVSRQKPTTMLAAFRSTRAILLACVLCLAVRHRVEPRLGTPPCAPPRIHHPYYLFQC